MLIFHTNFRDNSVDVIISDLPFGKRCGTKSDNRVLYPKTLLGKFIIFMREATSTDHFVNPSIRYNSKLLKRTLDLGSQPRLS